jgi:hypothetical protein
MDSLAFLLLRISESDRRGIIRNEIERNFHYKTLCELAEKTTFTEFVPKKARDEGY